MLHWRMLEHLPAVGTESCIIASSLMVTRAGWKHLAGVPVLGVFHRFCQHGEAANDCFPASAQVAAVRSTCFTETARWFLHRFTDLLDSFQFLLSSAVKQL